tara:strand:- start:7167 stop:7736 length:570 start_codon:yes stop_codon:yes gene_type:complete
MKPIKDYYWVKVEKETEDTIEINGVEMYRDTSYDPMKLARQFGTIYKTPIHSPEGADLEEGDKVWFHHFIPTEVNKVKYADSENVYQAQIQHIYLRERDGEYKAVGDWNFVEQEVKEPEQTASGIILETEGKDVELHGKTVFINSWMEEQGVEEGDRVFFSENSEYDMNIDGRSLLRMRNFDILAVYGK